MSTATLERAASATEWSDWKVGDDGIGERRHVVYRERVAGSGEPLEWHTSAGRKAIKYTLAGAEKKAWELNRDLADAKRRDAWLAQREAERREQQTLAQEIREVAQCGTQNSEMIARWIIGNYTHNDEAAELREIANDAQISATNERKQAEWAEKQLDKTRERCNEVAEEARELLTQLGAFGAPLIANPLEFAAGNTPLEQVVDMSRNLLAALAAYDQES